MSKILIATEKPFAKSAVDQIQQIIDEAGYTFAKLEKYTDKSQLLDAVKDATAIIIRSDKIDEEVIAAANELKIVVRAGAGYDNVDLKAASAKNIVVMNTPGQNSNAVAELAMGMMVLMARNQFNGTSGTELSGKNLGIHAYGYIGKIVATLANGFGMKVSAFDPFISKDEIEKDGVTAIDSVEQLYAENQYLSLHIPANDKTKNSINYDLLSKMPKGATLVNTARKEVIDESGLAKMLETREDFKYATDIGASIGDELTSKFGIRYFATPKKMGAQTAEANVNAGVAAANQIVGFLKSDDTTFQVN